MKWSWTRKLPIALVAYHISVCALIFGMRNEGLLNVLMALELPVLPIILPLSLVIPIRGNPTVGGVWVLGIAALAWIGYGVVIGSWIDRRLSRSR